jgi:non-ribosomal peptide synthase protein (TIGR01720 family)
MPEITSYEEWAATLAEYAATDQPRADGQYWLSDLSGCEYLRLPVDEIADADTNVVRTTHTVRGRLGQSETKALLSRVPEAYGTRITEVLVAALVGVLGNWTGPGALLVDLEGHGRDELVTDVDVTRTVGWFTTCYPLKFEVMPDASSNPAEMDEATIVAVLKHVKEQMRKVYSGGLPFGILRYLNPSLVEADHLAELEEQVEVSFNYLGQFDQLVGGLINEADENSGATQDVRELRKYLLEVNALVLGGQLRIGWNYSEAIHRRERIEELMNNYLKWLEKLIAHCETEGAGGYTPSDFPLVSLSQEQIDKLHATFGNDAV